MPEALGALILTAILPTATAATVASTAIVAGVTVADLVGSVALAGLEIGIGLLLQPGLPPAEQGHQPIKQTIPPRNRVRGRLRIGGAYMLYEQYAGISYDVYALCQGPISRYVEFLLHDDIIEFVAGGDPTFPGGAYVLGAPDILDGRYSGNNVSIETRYGLNSELAYASILNISGFANIWTSAHQLNGIASATLQCYGVSLDEFQNIFPNGLPKLSAVVEGPNIWDFTDANQSPINPATGMSWPIYSPTATYKLNDRVFFNNILYQSLIPSSYNFPPDDSSGKWVNVYANYPGYDPTVTYNINDRCVYLGSVYKSAVAANLNNPPDTSRGIWFLVSANPVLQLVDYLIDPDGGLGLDRTVLIDPVLPALIKEVNLCYTLFLRQDLDYEPRYACSLFNTFDTSPDKVIGAILATCDGWMSLNPNGSLALVVGAYRDEGAPVIQDRHILAMTMDTGVEDEEYINELTINFTSPEHKYRTIDGQPWRNEADITARGVRRTQPLDLTGVQSHPQARRLAKRQMAQLEAPMRGSGVLTWYGLTLLGVRWCELQYSLIAGMEDIFLQIERIEPDFMAQTVSFDWRQIFPATIDEWNPSTEEGMEPPDPDEMGSTDLPVPQDVTASSVGTLANGTQILVTFDDPGRPDLTYAMRYRLADDGTGHPGPWVTQPAISPTSNGTTITIVTAVVVGSSTFVIEVASVSAFGTLSAWSNPITIATVGTTGRITEDGQARVTQDSQQRVTES